MKGKEPIEYGEECNTQMCSFMSETIAIALQARRKMKDVLDEGISLAQVMEVQMAKVADGVAEHSFKVLHR